MSNKKQETHFLNRRDAEVTRTCAKLRLRVRFLKVQEKSQQLI